MKKILAAALLILAPVYLFAATAVNAKKNSGSKKSSGIEFGIGSGYVFYGDSETKDLISDMIYFGKAVTIAIFWIIHLTAESN